MAVDDGGRIWDASLHPLRQPQVRQEGGKVFDRSSSRLLIIFFTFSPWAYFRLHHLPESSNHLPVIGNEVRHRTVGFRFLDTARVLLDPLILSARRPGTRGVAALILYFADFRYFDYFRTSDW